MPLTLRNIELLFASPLLHFTVPESGALNRDLLALGGTLRDATEGIQRSNRNGWHSEGNIFEEDAPAVSELRGWVEVALEATMDKLSAKGDGPKPRFSLEGWMNINPQGAFNAPHTHPDCQWAGVYYVAQPEPKGRNGGMLEFLDPRPELHDYKGLRVKAFQASRTLRGQPGELYLFPAYLLHWVYPNETEEERVSIAFNAKLLPPEAPAEASAEAPMEAEAGKEVSKEVAA